MHRYYLHFYISENSIFLLLLEFSASLDFYSECEDFNKWKKDKSKTIASDENDVVKATKAFGKFMTDFSTNK